MKMIYMTMAALSALAVAAPVAAQSWQGNRSNVAELQIQLDTGIRRGTITRREAMPLRASLQQLIRMERHFRAGGFSRSERNTLQLRSAGLDSQIDRAARNGNRIAGYDRDDRRDFAADDRRDRGGKDDFAMDNRRDNRGDRFAGDVRIGQRFNDRQVALPMQYRARYQDSDASYYRYDEDRIYQIDRRTGLILAMFSIGG